MRGSTATREFFDGLKANVRQACLPGDRDRAPRLRCVYPSRAVCASERSHRGGDRRCRA